MSNMNTRDDLTHPNVSKTIINDCRISRPFMSLTMTVVSDSGSEAGAVEGLTATKFVTRPELPEEFKVALAAERGEKSLRRIHRSAMSIALDSVISSNSGRPSGNILYFPPEWETK